MMSSTKNHSLLALAAAFVFLAALTSPARSQPADSIVKLQPANPPDLRSVRWRRIGPQLTALHERYTAHRATASAQAFASPDPFLRIANDMVLIDTAADGDVDELKAALARLGAVDIVSFRRVVSARLPLAAIPKLADVQTLRFARPSRAMTRVGATTSQGDAAMKTDDARAAPPAGFGFDGSGITVGVLSDTFDCGGLFLTDYAIDVASFDLPAGIEVLDDTGCGSDEGRAMMQLIYDVAPAAGFSFHTATGGQAGFAIGIQELAGCPTGSDPGCIAPAIDPAEVIVDDYGYNDEPYFLDGIIAQAVDVVNDAGVPYFSAAGNNARASWEGNYRASGIQPPGYPFLSGDAHDFDPGPGTDIYQKVFIPNDTALTFQWEQPFFSVSGPPGAANNVDVCFYPDPAPGAGPFLCSLIINLGADPLLSFTLGGPQTINIAIIKDTFLPTFPDPGMMKYVVSNPAFSVLDPYPGALASTLVGHPNSRGAIGVGAAFYFDTPEFGTDPAVLESFSSAGGTPILFDDAGLPVLTIVRERPQIVGPDDGNTTFFGLDIPDPGDGSDVDNFPNFSGTSASAPHLAGLAALMLEANPDLTPSGVEDVLTSSADDMGPTGFDFDSGFGFVDGFDAVGSVDDSLFCDGVFDLDLSGSPGPGTFSATNSIRFGDGDFSDITGIADMHIFADGFESGDTSSWSNTCP